MATKAFTTIGGGVNNQEVRSQIVFTVPIDPATGEALPSDVSSIGSPDDPAWNGTDASASLISIMKACHARLAEIVENTGV